MTLLALIRKRDTGKLATAIPAISAIPAGDATGDERRIARIATVAVANPKEVKPTAALFEDELFQERAAIYQFDAGFTRQEAEARAMKEVTSYETRSHVRS